LPRIGHPYTSSILPAKSPFSPFTFFVSSCTEVGNCLNGKF
jgi:hypothetical protein